MLQHKTLVTRLRPHLYRSFFLGADVGGTNVSIVLAGLTQPGASGSVERERLEMVASFGCKTADVSDFNELMGEVVDYCLKKCGAQIKAIAIAAAGPVEGHRWCRLTNFDLEMDTEKLGDKLNIPCFLLNDFEALGYSINFLEAEKPELLQKLGRGGRVVEGTPGARALLGVGTGLGKAILMSNPELGFYTTLPSEGGHADFPAQDALEWEMVSHIQDVTGYPVYYEDLLSGRGLGNMYSFIRNKMSLPASRYAAVIEQAIDKAPAISKYSLEDAAAKATADMLVRIFARCARNFALDVLARGGVYIGGGVVEKNLDWFTSGAFINEFERHRQYRPVLEQMPVSVITLRDAGMYGSAFVASKGEELWSRIV